MTSMRSITLTVTLRLLLIGGVFFSIACAQETDLSRALRALPGVVDVKHSRVDSLFRESYEILLTQPVDHSNPSGQTFVQHVWLSHVDSAKPMVLETEGYAVYGGERPRELTRILRCNQVVVEYRYFGKSKPDPVRWESLTLEQASNDLHHIRTLLAALYPGKWISTGVSKGGQTTLHYRCYYPNDVDVSVPYVAPMPIAVEDPRIFTWFRTVGDSVCRAHIEEFQLDCIRREAEIVPALQAYAESKKLNITRMGYGRAFEYLVLEYPFSFWQWGNASCSAIPPSGTPTDAMLKHLLAVVPANDYTDEGIVGLEPFFVQAYTQLGYYRYDISLFKPYLHYTSDPTNSIFAPAGVQLTYKPDAAQHIIRWLQLHGDNILYVYGGNDTWTSCAVELTGMSNAVKVVKPGGSHGTRISNLPPAQRELVLATLERWLGIPVMR